MFFFLKSEAMQMANTLTDSLCTVTVSYSL